MSKTTPIFVKSKYFIDNLLCTNTQKKKVQIIVKLIYLSILSRN